MTLPTSGELAMARINMELRRAASSQISLDAAENGGYAAINQNSPSRPNSANPAAISEWYGYNHVARPTGPNLVPMPEVGFDAFDLNRACFNSVQRPGEFWGSEEVLEISASEQQFWTNAAGTLRPRRGWYAQGADGAIFWDGTRPTRLEVCRI